MTIPWLVKISSRPLVKKGKKVATKFFPFPQKTFNNRNYIKSCYKNKENTNWTDN